LQIAVNRGGGMKIIRLISIVNFLFILLLLSNAYAEYPTSTPQFIESIDFGDIISGHSTIESSSKAAESKYSSTQSSYSFAAVTWTGEGDNNDASNPENWSGDEVPQNGVDVVFDSTSKNCEWNLTVNIASLTINSGYSGTVTLSSGSNLNIVKTIKWTGNALNDDKSASNPNNWSGSVVPQNGDNIVFDGTSQRNCTWDININPAFLSMTGYTGTITLNNSLVINGSLTIAGGRLNLNNKNLSVDGYLLIGSGGTLDATSSPLVTITVKGNWANYDSFIPGLSTVILAGTNQYIYGSTTFYNLIKTVTSADTLYFEAGYIQTIINNLTLQGSDGNLLSLRSTKDGQPSPEWYIDPQGTRNISFADIKDMYNKNYTTIIFVPASNVVNTGNNNGVSFGGSECVCLPPLWQRGVRGDFENDWRATC
jgi:hypothetical protein